MFVVIGLMLQGIVVGRLFRNRNLNFTTKLITILIWILLFLLGIDVGGNDKIMNNLHTIGLEAFIIAGAATLGSITMAKLLWNYINRKKESL